MHVPMGVMIILVLFLPHINKLAQEAVIALARSPVLIHLLLG
jgi:hypothetical protein